MMSEPSRLSFLGMTLACAAFLAACGDSARLQFVTVAPISGEIYVSAAPAGGVRGADHRGARPALVAPPATGRRPEAAIAPVTATCGSLQYAATAVFSNGSTQNVSSTATWISSNQAAATVSSTGLATGIGLGTTGISASFGGVTSASETLAVDQLNSITLSPAAPNVPLGGTQSFMAIGGFTFAAGGSGSLDVSSQVTWGSTNTSVATIDTTGIATATGLGATTITATSCDGITVGQTTMTVGPPAAASLVVTPATITISTGTTTLFTAMEKLSDGTIQPLPPGTVVTWGSGTTTIATIDPVTAIALGVATGTSTITATETVSGFTGNATLTVQAAAARFAYIANGSGGGPTQVGTISGYTVDVAGGTFTPLAGSPFTAFGPQQILIHPSGDLMYFVDRVGSLRLFDINSTDGSIADSGQAPVAASASTSSANVGVIDPMGRFIYVVSDSGNSIYGFSIAQTTSKATNGALTLVQIVTAPTDPTLNSPTWIMTDRSGKYAYVVNNLGNSISEYAITQTGANAGALVPLGTASIPTGNGPTFGTTDVNGHLYVANNGTTTQSVSGYSIGSNGQLTSVGADFIVTGAVSTINVITDPTGKYLYVLDSPPTAGQVFAYNLDSTGAITTPQIGTAQPTGQGPIGMAIDPTGALLAIDNNTDSTISLFKVGTTTGAVTPASPATVNADTAAQFVTFYTAASGQ